MQKTVARIINVTRMSTSKKFSKVELVYTPGNQVDADRLKLKVSDLEGQSVTSVTGFAGAENSIQISPEDESGLSLNVTCKSRDAVAVGTITGAARYSCVGVEKAQMQKEKVINSSTEMGQILSDGIMTKSGSLMINGEGAAVAGQGIVVMTQLAPSNYDSVIMTRTNLSTATRLEISRPGYSVKLNCKPTL